MSMCVSMRVWHGTGSGNAASSGILYSTMQIQTNVHSLTKCGVI